MTTTTKAPDTVLDTTMDMERLRAFLAAADEAAEALLTYRGIICPMATFVCDNREEYIKILESLTARFLGAHETTDVDDVVHFSEYDAHVTVAQMIGYAMGLRAARGAVGA